LPSVAIVGLDIGSTAVRAVQATRNGQHAVINHFGLEVLPEGAVVAGVVKDDRAVTAALKNLWSSSSFKTKKVALGVTHQQVVVREIEVANLPAKEFRQALPFLVKDVLPLRAEDAILDFHRLADPGKDETVRGLLIAVPKDAVLSLVRAVERAGLQVEQVDLACFAALRAAAQLCAETEALIDLGANASNVVIHTDGVPQIVRNIPRGGADVTKLVASRLGVSVPDAEALKVRVGLAGEAEDRETAEVIAEALRPLITELRTSLRYHETANPGAPVRRLSLVGGAAQLRGLSEHLSAALGVPVDLADPFQRVDDTRRGGRHDLLGRSRSSAAVSIGLTLGAA
jgi:type IV pilus assembly protein PilM